MSKKSSMLWAIITGVAILLIYVGIINRYETKVFLNINMMQDGQYEISLSEQQFFIWEKAQKKTEEYNVANIKMQSDCGGNGNYLFLPQYMDLSEVYVSLVLPETGDTEICLDDVVLKQNSILQIGTLSEGNHTLKTGNEELIFCVMKGSEIPSVWIETDSPMEYVLEEKGNETTAEICILSGEGNKEYAGVVESFRGRGNSTWYQNKKSFGLTLKQSAPLLGMKPGRSWVLLAGSFDNTVIRNKIIMDMAQECGMQNAVSGEFADVYINGEYKGCYLLTEKITIGTGRMEIGDLEEKTELVNDLPLVEYPRYIVGENAEKKGYYIAQNPTDISGGYLLEVEMYINRYGLESSGFITQNGVPLVMVSPEYASAEQVDYIANIVQAFENALESPDGYNSSGIHYSEYIDMESFVLRYLIDEYSKSLDAGYSSYFLYKPQGEDKLYAGPVWDYDTSLGENGLYGDTTVLRDPEGMYVNSANWSAMFWNQDDFVDMCGVVYEEKCLPYLDYLTEEGLENYISQIYESSEMNAVYYEIENLDEEYDFLKYFVKERKEYLEEELTGE